jgi:hypothetical protein
VFLGQRLELIVRPPAHPVKTGQARQGIQPTLPVNSTDLTGQKILGCYGSMKVEGIKKGHACNALCQATQKTGQLPLTHFSTIVGDTNELPDGVTIEHLKK